MKNKFSPTEKELREEDVPRFEPINIHHYRILQLKYINDRRYYKEINEHREITEIEMNDEIPELQREFRRWYYEKFPSKVVQNKLKN